MFEKVSMESHDPNNMLPLFCGYRAAPHFFKRLTSLTAQNAASKKERRLDIANQHTKFGSHKPSQVPNN